MTPQIDVGYINDILSNHGRKNLDPFKMNRLNKAVQLLERQDGVQGIAARADYYTYNNEPEKALKTTLKAVEYYGYDLQLARSLVRAAVEIGNWNSLKKIFEDILVLTPFASETYFLDAYMKFSCFNIDNSGKFKDILDANNVEGRTQVYSYISSLHTELLSQDCSLEVYRKVLSKSFRAIYNKYSGSFMADFRIQNLQLIISNEHWSLEETLELTEDVNNAILEDSDLDFQISADEIEVFCINFPTENVPEDFVYYEDDDDELIKLVQSRMENNPSPEEDGEALYV